MSKKRTGVLVALSATALLVVGGLAWEQVFPNRQANASEDASQLAQASAGTSAATDDQSEQALTYTPLPAIPADYDPSAGHFEYPEGYDTSKGEFVYPDDPYDAPHFKRYKEPEDDETVIPFGTSNTPRVQTIIPVDKGVLLNNKVKEERATYPDGTKRNHATFDWDGDMLVRVSDATYYKNLSKAPQDIQDKMAGKHGTGDMSVLEVHVTLKNVSATPRQFDNSDRPAHFNASVFTFLVWRLDISLPPKSKQTTTGILITISPWEARPHSSCCI